MRLVYLDEAGTTSAATSLAVAGVIVQGDDQWSKVDQRIVRLIEKYIPEEDRLGFVFHATDIFHGSRYFDRKNPSWADREYRWGILEDLARIITDLGLPVVFGAREKVVQVWDDDAEAVVHVRPEADALHLHSAVDCLYWADIWLTAYAQNELATVVHEDGASAKATIREAVRALRYPETLTPDAEEYFTRVYGLPFQHIIDTVHFAEKADARLLQLADLCAFMVSRAIQGRQVPPKVMRLILEGADWMMRFKDQTNAVLAALQAMRP